MPLNASNVLGVGSTGFDTLIQSDRQFIGAALLDKNGIVRNDDFLVTAAATTHSVNISSGKAAFPGSNAADQGYYFAWSESAETEPLLTPDANNPRIDTLILRVADPQYGTVTGTVGARWDMIMGVPAASPAARSDNEINTTFYVPGAWMRCADIRLNTTDTGPIPGSQITDRRPNPHNWTSFTPSFAGFTVGNGSFTAKYKKIDDKTVSFRISFTFGTTSTFTDLFEINNLPFSGPGSQAVVGHVVDASASSRFPVAGSFAGNTIQRTFIPSGGTGLGPTNPFTWAATDTWSLNGTVEVT